MTASAPHPLRWFTAVGMAAQICAADPAILERAAALEAAGDFTWADALLEEALQAPPATPQHRRTLEWERERLRRIRLDYPLTADTLYDALDQSMEGLTRREFERWRRAGRFDARLIDGEERFVSPSVSNLYFRHPELNARRRTPTNPASLQRAYLDTARAVAADAHRAGTPGVQPQRLLVTMRIALKPGVARPGERVRCWMPFPRRLPFQEPAVLVRSTPPGAQAGPEESAIRCAYLEQTAPATGEPQFEIHYRYTPSAVSFDLDADRATPSDPGDPALAPFLGEAPHVVFTDAMRELARKVAGREANPVRKARRFHEWIAQNIRYSFAREYSTIRNLGAYCLEHRYGDCGQETFLFMTLCRLSGIPARWQSGWTLFPGADTIHDWCEIHLPPWGWVPVDPYMGIYAMQYAPSLSRAERRELRDFYFGGLDPWRLVANADHNQDLTPAKESFRSDTVDFQRGEVEVAGRNVYFGDFTYRLEWQPAAGGTAP